MWYKLGTDIFGLFPRMTPADNNVVAIMRQVFPAVHQLVAWTNFVFPIDTLFQIIALRIAWYGIVLGYVTIHKILATMHLIGE